MVNLPPQGVMQEKTHLFPLRVYYEDTDFSGVVYHASYLKFLERGRTEYIRALDIHQGQMFNSGAAFMVREMQLVFLKPAKVDDILHITTTPLDAKGASFTLSQQILRGQEVLLTAQVKIVHVIHNKPARLPLSLRPIFTPF
jgi:acyl-CoA thioester hydrolase